MSHVKNMQNMYNMSNMYNSISTQRWGCDISHMMPQTHTQKCAKISILYIFHRIQHIAIVSNLGNPPRVSLE
jgi:hypothetical protein